MTEVVQGLVRHAAGHGSVTDDGDHPPVGLVLEVEGHGQAVGVPEDGGGVAVLDPVVWRLRPRRVAGQAVGLPQRAEPVPPAGQDLVDVGLVAGVPEQQIPGGIEDPVQGQGQLDDTQVGAEVAAGDRDGLHDEGANLAGQLDELVLIELPEVARPGDRLQKHPDKSRYPRRAGFSNQAAATVCSGWTSTGSST